MQGKGIRLGIFVGLLLFGGVRAGERDGGFDEGVVRYSGMRVLKAAHQRELERAESVSLPGATDSLEQRQEDLGERWETLRDLREPGDDMQGSAVIQRRNARDFTAEGVARQMVVSQGQTRRSLVGLLACCFCVSQGEDETDSIDLAEQEVRSVMSNSWSLRVGSRSHTSTPDIVGRSHRDSLELVEVSPTHSPLPSPILNNELPELAKSPVSRLSVPSRRPSTPYPGSVSSSEYNSDGKCA